MIKIIRKEDTKTTAWSGGTTTQLAIFPESGDYARREFVWRVSSARVEVEESEFTSLPGVARCLVILDGELWLNHEGHYELEIGRLQQDNFDGGWRTVSRGRVTDFNLMVKAGEGRVQVCEVAPASVADVSLMPLVTEYAMVSEVFYILNGCLGVCDATGKDMTVNAGDVVVVTNTSDDYISVLRISNNSSAKAEIVRSIIYHN